MEARGLDIAEERGKWVGMVSSHKVDVEDFEEVVQALQTIA